MKLNNQLVKNAYIIFLFIRKIALYLIISFVPNFLFYFSDSLQIERRQSPEADMELISMILSIIFMITFVALLYSTKKHIFDIGVTDRIKIKEQVKFETCLAVGSISVYLLISAILAIFLDDKMFKISLYIPLFVFYKFLHNAWLSLVLAILMYILFAFIVLVIPYIKRKRSIATDKKNQIDTIKDKFINKYRS